MSRIANASSKLRKVSHVIFDLDGTLLDTERIYKEVFTEMGKQHGKQYTTEIQLKLMGRPDQIGAEIAVKEMKLPLSPEQFLKEFRLRAEKLLPDCNLMPGAQPIVQHLRMNEIPIAVATSSNAESVAIKIAKHKDFFNLFHHMVCGDDPEVKNSKPAPDIFLVCASRFPDKPAPKDCLVYEDAPNGVQAAVSAGMQCIMIPDPNTPEEQRSKATQVLKTFTDTQFELYGLPTLSNPMPASDLKATAI